MEGLLLPQRRQERPWSLPLRGFHLRQQNTSDATGVGFPQQAILQVSPDTTGCPVICHSNANYPELVQTPQAKGRFPPGCPPLQRHQSQVAGAQVTHTLAQFGYRSGVPVSPSSDATTRCKELTGIRETLYFHCWVLTKDMWERPDEEVTG